MRNQWSESEQDMKWLRDVCLRGVQLPAEFAGFKAAILQGNEDCPDAVNLYNSLEARITDDFCRVVFGDSVQVDIYSGETGEKRSA